jgi:uncharacterized protein
MKQAIVDTGVIVALLNKNDNYHQWAISQWKQVQAPAITCEAVISESCFLLKATYLQEVLMSMIEAGAIKTQFQLEDNVAKIKELMLRYGSVPMSFADACLVRMAEENPEFAILTIDSDFTIYRKNRNEVITIIIPQ